MCIKTKPLELSHTGRLSMTWLKKRIIEAHHDGVDGGHLGRDKTYAKVSQCSVTGTGSLIHIYIYNILSFHYGLAHFTAECSTFVAIHK